MNKNLLAREIVQFFDKCPRAIQSQRIAETERLIALHVPGEWLGKGEPKHPAVDELAKALAIINDQRQQIAQLERKLAEAQKQNAAMKDRFVKAIWLWRRYYTLSAMCEEIINGSAFAAADTATKEAISTPSTNDYLHRREVEPLVEALNVVNNWDDKPTGSTMEMLITVRKALQAWHKLSAERGWK